MAYTKTNSKLYSGVTTGISVADRQLGWTGLNVNISVSTTTKNLEGGQSRTPADILLVTKEFKATFSMREFEVKNIALALGLPASAVAANGSSADGVGTQPESVILVFEFLNEVNSKYLKFYVPAAKFAGNGAAPFNRDDQGDLAVEYAWNDDGTGKSFILIESLTSTW